MPAKPLKLAVIGGDGTGPEVTLEALKVLKAVSKKEKFSYTLKDFPFGGDRYIKTGKVIDDAEIAELKKYDAVLLGALGHPDVKPGILEKGILLRLRFELDQYINLRPVHLFPGVDTPLKDKGPKDINFDVIRENTEDLYSGGGGFLRKNTPNEVSTQEMVTTRFGVERCLRFAFNYCLQKKKAGKGNGQLTLVHKTNVLTYCGDTWFRAFNEIGEKEFPQVKRDYNHVDACCMWFVKSPEFYDTIVVPNMFGDIITDLAAIIQGGLGVAAGGNINPDPRKFDKAGNPISGSPSMYEPMGGSAPKYTGKNVINPLAAIGALGMLLANTTTADATTNKAMRRAAERVDAAIRKATPQMPSQAAGKMGRGTREIGDLVVSLL